MFPALKALNTAKAEGLIEQSEYDDHRAKILGGNPEAVRLWAGQGQDTEAGSGQCEHKAKWAVRL